MASKVTSAPVPVDKTIADLASYAQDIRRQTPEKTRGLDRVVNELAWESHPVNRMLPLMGPIYDSQCERKLISECELIAVLGDKKLGADMLPARVVKSILAEMEKEKLVGRIPDGRLFITYTFGRPQYMHAVPAVGTFEADYATINRLPPEHKKNVADVSIFGIVNVGAYCGPLWIPEKLPTDAATAKSYAEQVQAGLDKQIESFRAAGLIDGERAKKLRAIVYATAEVHRLNLLGEPATVKKVVDAIKKPLGRESDGGKLESTVSNFLEFDGRELFIIEAEWATVRPGVWGRCYCTYQYYDRNK